MTPFAEDNISCGSRLSAPTRLFSLPLYNALHRVFDPAFRHRHFHYQGRPQDSGSRLPSVFIPGKGQRFLSWLAKNITPTGNSLGNTLLAGHSRTRRFRGHRHCGRRTSEKSNTGLCWGRHNSGLRTPHCHNNPSQISPVELPELHQRIELCLRERSQEEFPTERN
jgi:hypothetical protein